MGKIARLELEKLVKIFQVLDVTKENCLQALSMKMPDFEGAVVAAVALSNDINIVVTRNVTDFQDSELYNLFTRGIFGALEKVIAAILNVSRFPYH